MAATTIGRKKPTIAVRARPSLSHIGQLSSVCCVPSSKSAESAASLDFRSNLDQPNLILKMLEKLVEVYLRDVVLGRHLLHKNQHICRMNFSMETASHEDYAVGTFLDIEGLFNNTSHEVICREAMLQVLHRLVQSGICSDNEL
ncbi:hypothetical protein ACFW04_007399 [Cataglyphis niger]